MLTSLLTLASQSQSEAQQIEANQGTGIDVRRGGGREEGGAAQRKLRGKIQVPMVLLGATVSA